MLSETMKAAHALFMTTLLKWTNALREEHNCCALHSSIAFIRAQEMDDAGLMLFNGALFGCVNEETFCKTMSAHITEMEKELARINLIAELPTHAFRQKEAMA